MVKKKRKIQYPQIKSLHNSILIIDEAHKIEGNDFGYAVREISKVSKNLKIILLQQHLWTILQEK